MNAVFMMAATSPPIPCNGHLSLSPHRIAKISKWLYTTAQYAQLRIHHILMIGRHQRVHSAFGRTDFHAVLQGFIQGYGTKSSAWIRSRTRSYHSPARFKSRHDITTLFREMELSSGGDIDQMRDSRPTTNKTGPKAIRTLSIAVEVSLGGILLPPLAWRKS